MTTNKMLLGVCVALAVASFSSASLLFDNADPPLTTTSRVSSIEGVAAYLQIGAAPVDIGQIAINAMPHQNGQLKFVIFSDSAPPGGTSGTLLYSNTVNVTASNSLSYILSNPFSFKLQAGQYYDIGAIFSGTSIDYTYDYTSDTQNGITSVVSDQNIDDFAAPVQYGHGGVSDIDIQLFSPAGTAVPEPANFLGVVFGFSLIALLAISRRESLT